MILKTVSEGLYAGKIEPAGTSDTHQRHNKDRRGPKVEYKYVGGFCSTMFASHT